MIENGIELGKVNALYGMARQGASDLHFMGEAVEHMLASSAYSAEQVELLYKARQYKELFNYCIEFIQSMQYDLKNEFRQLPYVEADMQEIEKYLDIKR